MVDTKNRSPFFVSVKNIDHYNKKSMGVTVNRFSSSDGRGGQMVLGPSLCRCAPMGQGRRSGQGCGALARGEHNGGRQWWMCTTVGAREERL
jgi:hypothetical protein